MLARTPRHRERRLASLLLALAGVLSIAAPAQAITPTITEFSSGLTAFSDPSSITAGPDGNLWFVEYPSPGRIGKISTSGAITEVATGGITPNFTSNPQVNGIVTGPDGQLWFTEGHSPGKVGRIDPSSGAVQELATGGVTPGFTVDSAPEEIGAGPDGNLWFPEVSNPGAITRVTQSGVVTEFSGGSGLSTNSQPNSITPTAAADGNLWFTETANPEKIGRVNPATGAIAEFSTGLEPAGDIRDIVPGPDGNVWFAQFANPGRIGKITPGGTITEVATGGVTPGFTANGNPDGIAAGPDGALWFTELSQPSGPGRIGRLDPATGTVQEFPTPTVASGPIQIVRGPDGNMWFTEFAASKIARITTPPTATTLDATDVRATAATIGGVANGHAQPTSFHIEYGPVGGATISAPEQALGTTAGDTAVSAKLTGLTQNTSYQARVVVSNPTGASAGAPVTFKTAPAAPVITGARQSAKRWREGSALARFSRKRKPPIGTTITFSLDQPAQVRFNFQKLASGRRDHGFCRPPSKRTRHNPRCKRRVMVAALFFDGHPGVNKVVFQGRISRRKRLRPRPYVLAINAYNSAGQGSKTTRLRFTIVR